MRTRYGFASLVVSAVAFVMGCKHAEPVRSSGIDAFVGPVPVADVAFIILNARELMRLTPTDGGYAEPARPVLPFTIIVTELDPSGEAGSVECAWDQRGLVSDHARYADRRVREMAQAEDAEMRDAGVSARELAWYEAMRISPDTERPILALHFDERLQATPAPTKKVTDGGRTYWTAFLCRDADRAALLLDYVDAPLDGRGFVLVLRQGDQRWELLETRGVWIAGRPAPLRRLRV